MRHPQALDAIALVGALAIIIGGMTWIGVHALRMVEQNDCTALLGNCQTAIAACEAQRDAILAEWQRCMEHLQWLEAACGKGK